MVDLLWVSIPSGVVVVHPKESTMPLGLSRGEMCQVIFRKDASVAARDQDV
jgi:hypothetical protein